MGWFDRLFRRRRRQRPTAAGPSPRRAALPVRARAFLVEPMEQRRLLATVPLVVGAVYQEKDTGADLHGDLITIQFQGGAPGTKLTRLVINGDQNTPGHSVGDMIFDTVKGGLGADEAVPFTIVSREGIDDVRWQVEDGSSRLMLELTGFDPGETLVISIDVDEIQQFDPNDPSLAHQNEGIDPIASGVEFQGSRLEATFKSRDYLDANGSAEFRNVYDSLFDGTSLLRSETNPNGLPRDNDDGLRDRSTGAALPLNQTPNPATLCGYVFIDRDNDGVRDAAESGITGVRLQLIPVDTVAPQSPVSLTTASDGSFCATGLMPGTYRLVETQPTDYLDGLDAPGRVGSETRGVAQNPGDEIRQIELHGGESAVDYSFAELLPSQLAGVAYHDRNLNGVRESGEEGIGNVIVRLFDAAGLVAQQVTAADGSYRFQRLPAGVYELVESQPDAWQDGLDTPGSINGVTVGRATNPGDRIDQIQLDWGQAGVDYNFGEWKFAGVQGQVRSSAGAGCVADGSGTPLANVVLELIDASGTVVSTTTTDGGGRYRFENVVPGEYTLRQQQPATHFTNGQVAGSAGGDASVDNVISRITLRSDQVAVNYDFCESPPASISGIVFRDGPTFLTSDGQLPPNWQSERDGVYTPDDDELLPGVWVELRDGVTGLPLTANDVLPGISLSNLRLRTDGAGRFEFQGLRGGRSYALYETQPASYVDGLDTAGSTGGVTFNPGEVPPPGVLEDLVEPPNGDAIVRISVRPGESSVNNNFSELAVRLKDEEPREPPVIPPPPETPPEYFVPPPPLVPFVLVSPPLPAPNVLVVTPQPWDGFTTGPSEMTWHLSVINAGYPRGEAGSVSADGVAWRNAAQLARWKWHSQRFQEAQWIVRLDLPDPESESQYRQFLFGLVDGIPITGDFNGDGQAEFGVYHQGEWFIDANGNGQWDPADLWAQLGSPGDLPVVGDWDGDGKDDIGIFGPEWQGDARALAYEPGLPDFENEIRERPKNLPPLPEEATNGRRWLKRPAEGEPRADLIDHVFRFGAEEDVPVVGDWDGDGINSIGVFRDGRWTLDSDGDGALGERDAAFDYGASGDRPVVGDFNGDGIDEVGIYRDGHWIIDTNNNRQLDDQDLRFDLGAAGDTPVTGDFDGDGDDEAGVYRPASPPASRQANAD